MGWFHGLDSTHIQDRCRQPGPVTQMLHEALDGQDVALQASPCPRGFAGKPKPMAHNICLTVTPPAEADHCRARNDGLLRFVVL